MSEAIGESVTLADLVGTRTLDARGQYVKRERGEDALVVLLRLDGTVYAFEEDPNDGYRSSLSDVRIETDEEQLRMLAEFRPMVLELRTRRDPCEHDILYGVNESTGLVVFEVGTSNSDDYYPSFVSSWTPEGESPWWLQPLEDES